MQQHQEIADLLRNLVSDHRKRSHQAKFYIGHERRCDQHAVDKIVKRVTDNNHHAAAPMIMAVIQVMFAVAEIVGVIVAPQHQFFQHEKE